MRGEENPGAKSPGDESHGVESPGGEGLGEGEGLVDVGAEVRAGGVYWRTRVGNGGWVRVERHSSEGSWWVLARVAPDRGGRLRIMELYLDDLDSETPVTSQRLRKLPLGQIEQLLNLPDERAGITGWLRYKGIDMKAVAARYSTSPAGEPSTPAGRAADDARRRAAELADRAIELRQPLAKPGRRPYPPGFYQRVAEAYRAAQRQGVGPVPFIAAEAGVPRTTAGYWVREARRRGYLGPATHGKAGEAGELTVRYTGSQDTTDVTLPNGLTRPVQQGGTLQLPTDLALGLLKQPIWEPAPNPSTPSRNPSGHHNHRGNPQPIPTSQTTQADRATASKAAGSAKRRSRQPPNRHNTQWPEDVVG